MSRFIKEVQKGRDALVVVTEADTHINKIEATIQDTLLYSFRYALGRSTYCVQDVCIAISKHKDILGDNTLGVIKKEIHDYLHNAPIGFTKEWKDLLKELENDPKSYSQSTLEVPR
jgi:hypothetical protein